jgi:hypothetical protein
MNASLFEIDPSGWVHICPKGEFPVNHPCMGPGGVSTVRRLVQVLDDQALDSLVNEFAAAASAAGDSFPGLLIDFDHFSEDTDKPSTAAGWLQQLRREGDDVLGLIRWTDKGLAAIQGGEFRFLSPTWLPADCESLGPDRIRPLRLSGGGLTNKPNISAMKPICNRGPMSDSQRKAMFAKRAAGPGGGPVGGPGGDTARPDVAVADLPFREPAVPGRITKPSENQPRRAGQAAPIQPVSASDLVPPSENFIRRLQDGISRALSPIGPIQPVGPAGAPAGQRAVLPIGPAVPVGPAGAPAGQRAVLPIGAAVPVGPAGWNEKRFTSPSIKKLIGNRIFQRLLNRAMSEEQRRAMFARLGSGGGAPSGAPLASGAAGGPSGPPRAPPAASPEAVAASGPITVAPAAPAAPEAAQGPFQAAPRPLTFDAETRTKAKQAEIDGIRGAMPAAPVLDTPVIQNLKALEAKLVGERMPPMQRQKALDAARQANDVAKRQMADMYKSALKATGGNRLKAEMLVQDQIFDAKKKFSEETGLWQRQNARDLKKIAGLEGDILEIAAKSNEETAKGDAKAKTAEEKTAEAKRKADIKAQLEVDKQAARDRAAAEKTRIAAEKATATRKASESSAGQAKAYADELKIRDRFWTAIQNGDLDAARAIYPTMDPEVVAAAIEALPKDPKKLASAVKSLKTMSPK